MPCPYRETNSAERISARQNRGNQVSDAEKSVLDKMYCSFCGKNQHEVGRMISGPSVHVCNECIDLMHEIVHGPGEKAAKVIDTNHLGEILTAIRRGTER